MHPPTEQRVRKVASNFKVSRAHRYSGSVYTILIFSLLSFLAESPVSYCVLPKSTFLFDREAPIPSARNLKPRGSVAGGSAHSHEP
jgi:hypothetical protein